MGILNQVVAIKIIIVIVIHLNIVQPDIIRISMIVIMDITQNIKLVPVVVIRSLAINVKPVAGMIVLLKSVCLSKNINLVAMFMERF